MVKYEMAWTERDYYFKTLRRAEEHRRGIRSLVGRNTLAVVMLRPVRGASFHQSRVLLNSLPANEKEQ